MRAASPTSPRSTARSSSDAHVLGRERLQLVDPGAREQRRVDLEVRVLGGGADQRHQPLLDRRQQRVLLGLVEAMDLIEEEDRRGAHLAALAGALDHGAHLGAPGLHGALLLEGCAGGAGDDPRERRLAGPGRPVQDHRVRVAGLDRPPQRRVLAEQVALADELLERLRAHPRGERHAGLGSRESRRPGLDELRIRSRRTRSSRLRSMSKRLSITAH